MSKAFHKIEEKFSLKIFIAKSGLNNELKIYRRLGNQDSLFLLHLIPEVTIKTK